MNERTKIKWKNVGDRALAVTGYGTLAIAGPVLGPIVALARLRSAKAKAEERGKPFSTADSVKFVAKPLYQVSLNSISSIAETYEHGTERLQEYDAEQAEIKKREAAEAAAREEARRQEIKKAESPENLKKSPVGAVIKCIREMRFFGTRFEAKATDFECVFNPQDEQIITNKYIFTRDAVLNRTKTERNFMIDTKLDKDAVVYEIPEILRDLVSREIKARVEKEQALLKQKEMNAQRQMFMDALNNEKQK
ncbi:MAG: hypothetical protein IJY99_03575 [Alphaproteobacteria bacterium]|nr:hypothetical protein [Alphaproteobacteria bacterium]